jgi:tetratricopeptide (TPR) repeat protein
MRRTLNVRAVYLLLGIALVFATCIHLLHAYQVEKNVGGLFRQAQRTLAKGQVAQAAAYLDRYLSLVPEDTEALAQFGQLLDQLADGPRGRFQAMQVLEQVLRRQPERLDLRRRVVILAIDQYRSREAISHLEKLLATAPAAERGELEHLLGWCQDAEGNYEAAAAAFQRAVQHAPGQIKSYVLLAEVLQERLVRPLDAGKALDAMVAANAGSSEALLARARFLQAKGDLGGAARDTAKASALNPGGGDTTLAAVDLARANGDLDKARSLLQQDVKTHSKNARIYATLADVELQAGRPAAAMACLRVGVKELPDAPDLLLALGDLLLDGSELAEVQAIMGRLQDLKPPPPRTEYLQARLLMKKQKWNEAIALLEKVRPQLASVPAWATQVEICLGQCHEQRGDLEQQLAAFRRAVQLNPSAPLAQYGLAVASLATGHLDDAVNGLRRLSKSADAPAATWTQLARALILRSRRRPGTRHDWREAEAALDHAAAQTPNAVDLTLLRAEILVSGQQLDEAFDLVEKARDRQQDQVRLWVALADITARQGKADAALTLLHQAEQRPALAGTVDLKLGFIQHWAGRRDLPASQGLARLVREAQSHAGPEQLRMLVELAEAYTRRGELELAQPLWQRLAELRPSDLQSRFALFEIALESGQEEAAEKVVKELRRLEGESGVRWRGAEVLRLVGRGDPSDRPRVAAARNLVTEISAIQKDYPKTPLLEARIDEVERDLPRAIDHYRQAMERGEQSPLLYYRLTQLLMQRRRFWDADQVVRKAEGAGPLRRDLIRLAADAALWNRDRTRAVQLARQAVPESMQNYRDLLWIARLLATAGETDEAEKMLRTAVQRAGGVPEVWAALVAVLARDGRSKEAEAVIDDARRQMPANRVSLVLARCYEALGDLDRAELQYRIALSGRPRDFRLLGTVADFFRRTDQPQKALPMLRRQVSPATQAPADALARARRQLAMLLAGGGKAKAKQDALALIERNAQILGATADDQRARAVILANRPGQRGEAVRQFDATLKGQAINEDDLFALAQLCDAAGAAERAHGIMLDLLTTSPENPQYLAYHIQSLLRQGELGSVRANLDKLERIEPRSERTQRLKALLAAKEGA